MPYVGTSGTHADPIMFDRLVLGTLLACVGVTTPAIVRAQMYDDSSAPDYGIECRAVHGQVEIDGTMQPIIARACLQPDGTWQIVRDGPGDTVLVYPVDAYPYPDLWYWGPPIYVGVGAGFFFVDHFHRFHHIERRDHGHPGSAGPRAFGGSTFYRGGGRGFGSGRGFNGARGFGDAHGFGGGHGFGRGGMRRR